MCPTWRGGMVLRTMNPCDRRTPDRAIRQNPAAGSRPPSRSRARVAIAPFAELERAPEHVHTYRVTPLGAVERACGRTRRRDRWLTRWSRYSRYAGAAALLVDVAGHHGPFRSAAAGQRPRARLGPADHRPGRLIEVGARPRGWPGCSAPGSTTTPIAVHASERGRLKQVLLKVGLAR